MANYTVVWDQVLEGNFIAAWTKSDSATRAVLTTIANQIDHELAVDPDTKGVARPDIGGRVLTIPASSAKVAAIYHVIPEDRKVLVVRLIFQQDR